MSLDIEKYRKRLIEERDHLTERISEVRGEATPPLEEGPVTTANAPVIDEFTDVQIGVADIMGHRLDQVNAALERIDNSTYGKCEVCGKQMDERRLDAEPMATTCINHAQEQEVGIATPTL